MYRSGNCVDLSQSQLDAARLGFTQMLRRKRFSGQFIARHCEDLLGTAQLEYARKVAEGVEIENPAGWIINCAWRRTMSLLEAQERTPRLVSTERTATLTDDLSRSAEDAALDEDRAHKVQAAVEQLSIDQRRLIELAYFEELPVREAARLLDWHPSKAQRCHESARRRLHELLGVQSLDELEIEVGLAAWLSLAAARTPATRVSLEQVTAVADELRGAASGLAERGRDLAARLLASGSGEGVSAAASGPLGKTVAGACAGALAACALTGVIGPGVDGVNLVAGGGHAKSPRRIAAAPAPRPSASASAASNPAPTRAPASSTHIGAQQGGGGSPAATTRAEHQASSQFGVESAAPGGSSGSASSTPAPGASAPSPSTPTATASGSSPTKAANQQFGLP
ncbi:MAG TPA: sigma-70 family RNA polymerase sigma factor [Solirubrobacterales bacterium]|nr:sigma-70 family RNA polymerase sigma factor [Solirubrobacterales bacterium]